VPVHAGRSTDRAKHSVTSDSKQVNIR